MSFGRPKHINTVGSWDIEVGSQRHGERDGGGVVGELKEWGRDRGLDCCQTHCLLMYFYIIRTIGQPRMMKSMV